MTKEEEIRFILSEYSIELQDEWVKLEASIYYVDGLPHGLIANMYNEEDGVIYIASATKSKHSTFTYSMIRDIIVQINTKNVCVIFEDNGIRTKEIASLLGRYQGTYEHIDNQVLWFNTKD